MGTVGTVGKRELRMKKEVVEAELASVNRVLASKKQRMPVFGDDGNQARRIEKALVRQAESEGRSTVGSKWKKFAKEYLEEGGARFFAANPYSRAQFAKVMKRAIEEVGWEEQLWAFTIIFPDKKMVWPVMTSDVEGEDVGDWIRESLEVGGGRVRARLTGLDFIGMFDIGVYRRDRSELAHAHFHGIVSGDPDYLRKKFPCKRGGLMNGRIYDLRPAYYPPGWLGYMAKDLRQVHYWVPLKRGYRYLPQPMPLDLLAYFAHGYRGLTKLDLTVAGGKGSQAMRLVRKQTPRG